MKKSLFLTFCFSFIPGAGQMYQNYMKRGLSLMCIGAILLILAIMTETVIFVVPFFVVMAYSFFDTYNIRNEMGTENQTEDEYILEEFNFDKLKNNKLLGIGVILIGVYILFNNILYGIARDTGLHVMLNFIRTIRTYLPSLIVSAITIGIGMKMISKK